MRNIPISTFIHTIFFVALISITALFFVFLEFDKQAYQTNQENRFELISNSFLTKFKHKPTKEELTVLSKKLNLREIEDREQNIHILNKAKVVYTKETKDSRVRVFSLFQNHYIYIQNIGYNLMYKIDIKINYTFYIAISIFIFILITILFLYIALLEKLKPLKILNNKIQQFSKGDMDIKVQIDSQDEIGQISKSFNDAINNINTLINSKNLFMKNILHELKTPITKGLFLANMIQTDQEKDKQQLINNFNTLNEIINQLSNISKLRTNHLQIHKQKIDLKRTVDQIIIMLDIKSSDIEIDMKDITITANKDLFGTMLKNLVENGLKYRSDKAVIIKTDKNMICVKSYGEKLKKPLSHYTQAFIQETKNSSGFGLGLYIVNEIAIMHNFELTYKYKNGYNIFCLNIQS